MLFHNQKVSFLYFSLFPCNYPFLRNCLAYLTFIYIIFLSLVSLYFRKKFLTYEMSLNIAWTLVKLFLTSSKKKKIKKVLRGRWMHEISYNGSKHLLICCYKKIKKKYCEMNILFSTDLLAQNRREWMENLNT